MGTLLCLSGIYAAALWPGTGFAFMAGFGMIFAILFASEAVRKISKYGLGTGVPSVGMFSIGIGCVISLYSLSLNSIWGPAVCAVLALIIGWVSGFLINKVLHMNIPSMEKRMSEMAVGSTLAMTASAIVIGGTLDSGFILQNFIGVGVAALGFIGCSLAIFHAFNANLGPDEAADRTRTLAILDGFLVMFVLGIVSFLSGDVVGPLVTIFISIVFILLTSYRYWTYIQRDAWKITSTGLLPGEEDLN
ncbi:MAG: tetrahydromethanopterin S-methyltransferase subunit C [Methanimicrococcus sp.]|nr:tetrahydromethanopterin S-methyltransferase subunit C [Methanimicrococcus sp.]